MFDVQNIISSEMQVVIAHEVLRRAAALRARQSEIFVNEPESNYDRERNELDEESQHNSGIDADSRVHD